jgi:hypothetical protein
MRTPDILIFSKIVNYSPNFFRFQVREERLKAYAAKKSKKPALIAKTSVLLDVKPWDDETDMDAMLKCIKTIVKDGLVWGACKDFYLLPVTF